MTILSFREFTESVNEHFHRQVKIIRSYRPSRDVGVYRKQPITMTKNVDVFINPSQADLAKVLKNTDYTRSDLAKEGTFDEYTGEIVRLGYNLKTGDLYLWDETSHDEMAKHVGPFQLRFEYQMGDDTIKSSTAMAVKPFATLGLLRKLSRLFPQATYIETGVNDKEPISKLMNDK